MELEIKNTLKEQGFSATKSRMTILRALLASQPVSLQTLINSLTEVDRATVYRTVDLFTDLSITKKVYTGLKYRIELSDSFQAHHHHLTCLRCRKIIDFKTPEIERAVEKTIIDNGFRPVRHDIEIAGYCANCT